METPARVGKYEIEQFLGGGMAHVYKARDTVLGRRVALKMLTEAAMADPEAKARFLEEARTASNMRHENIISVYDFGEDNGRPFMVMEFLEGESLRDAIANDSLGALERRLKIAVQAGRAIDYIHARKIIHRDIKPENVHVDLTGRVKLMDFGIAKSDGVALTRPGLTLGTPFYMAPEQVLGRPLTPHADIYSFGIVMYEMLTGIKPVTASSVEKIFQQIIYDPLKTEPLLQAKVPAPVMDLIVRMTTKQVIQRPSNLGLVCDQLEKMMETGYAPPPGSSPVAPPAAVANPSGPAQATAPAMKPAAQAPAAQPQTKAAPVKIGPGVPVALPAFIKKLPKELQTPTSLMILAFAGVAFFIMLLYALLLKLRLI
jgi:eukaryotic-like serine/threonine-protein kinase